MPSACSSLSADSSRCIRQSSRRLHYRRPHRHPRQRRRGRLLRDRGHIEAWRAAPPDQWIASWKRARGVHEAARDRKSTRLNSSHVSISYAVFCVKKKILMQVEQFAATKYLIALFKGDALPTE